MVTFDNGDLVIRIPNAGTFEEWANLNAALFEAYYFAVKAYANGEGIGDDPFITLLLPLAKAMQGFGGKAMFAATKAIEAATVREEVGA